MIFPPSTLIVCPTMYAACGEARKTAMAAENRRHVEGGSTVDEDVHPRDPSVNGFDRRGDIRYGLEFFDVIA
jgi:hypothetical protein